MRCPIALWNIGAQISHKKMKSAHTVSRLSRTELLIPIQPWMPRKTFRPYFQLPSRNAFSVSCRHPAVTAPDIDTEMPPAYASARVVPASPAYFTARPLFTDSLAFLQDLLRKYRTLPIVKPGQAPRVAWHTLSQYHQVLGEDVKAAKYKKILSILNRLNSIYPELMPQDVAETMQKYKRDVDPFLNKPRPTFVDEHGRAYGLGRRKSSTASVWVVEGEGEVLINGKPLNQRFGRVHDRESVIWALKVTQRVDKYNVWGIVKGGGTTGQAEALTLAIAKALMVHEPMLKPALRRAGCVTRDPRRVERKKPGKLKARKMPAWVKR